MCYYLGEIMIKSSGNYFNKLDYKNLKDKYGEDFAHFCRDNFQDIAMSRSVFELINSLFFPNKSLYEDLKTHNSLTQFVNYVYSKADIKKTAITPSTEDPFDLMRKAGYTMYECKTFDDILEFKKYYIPREALCSFNSPKKINHYYFFFALKDGTTIDGINGKSRDNFKELSINDEYALSVICIQISKQKLAKIHICNRYNHSVPFSDAAFNCDLEKIIPGLTSSFSHKYGINFNLSYQKFEIPNYVQDKTGRFYKYNYKIHDNLYFCANNVYIKNGIARKIDQSKFELIDYFLIDKHKKTIRVATNELIDSLPDQLHNIKKIDILSVGDNREITFYNENNQTAKMIVDRNNKLIHYENNFIENVNDNFLYMSNIESVKLPNAKSFGEYCLFDCPNLKNLSAPKCETLGDYCLVFNDSLKTLTLESATHLGNGIAENCKELITIHIPNAERIKDNFAMLCPNLNHIYAPVLEIVGSNFASTTTKLEFCNLSNLSKHGARFLRGLNKDQKLELHLPILPKKNSRNDTNSTDIIM